MRSGNIRRRKRENGNEKKGGAGRSERSAERKHVSYNAIVGGGMFEALMIAAIVVAALACPVMMLLGRREIGPGCAMMGCEPKKADELGELRQREREIATRITELEAAERSSPRIVGRTR